jgi:hypothetical protein
VSFDTLMMEINFQSGADKLRDFLLFPVSFVIQTVSLLMVLIGGNRDDHCVMRDKKVRSTTEECVLLDERKVWRFLKVA